MLAPDPDGAPDNDDRDTRRDAPAGATLEARLTVDLAAIAANWRALDALSAPEVETAAVVKADAYGLGAAAVAPVLAEAGARRFFVALPVEGLRLRDILGPEPEIYILGGYGAADRAAFERAALRPVINSLAQGNAWFEGGPAGPCALQLDSGMNRLGLERDELATVETLPEPVGFVMSHLACADEPAHGQNHAQLAAFENMTAGLDRPRSLAATGGTLMGAAFHHDLTRPGIGLYGGLPFADAAPVVRLDVPIIQIREVARGEPVGYGAAWTATRPSRIATLAIGYADGLIRAAGNRATAHLAGRALPYAGRVSMDLITLDVTDCPEAAEGAMVELLGPGCSVDRLATAAGTIGYEILTSLGARYARVYTG
ncbi:MAG: alanine racemase [Pseudomonadota bacterium]